MIRSLFPFDRFKIFSGNLTSYLQPDGALSEFHSGLPLKEHFFTLIQERKTQYRVEIRNALAEALKKQSKSGGFHPSQEESIRLIREGNALSVSCGHQLVFGGGPMYFAYKVLTTLKLAEELKSRFPETHFVPVFWMASEDHDLEEIRTFRFFGNPVTLSTRVETGAVGRIPADGIREQLEQIRDFPAWLSDCYGEGKTLSDAFREMLNRAFGDRGLLVLDADDPELKRLFWPVMRRELEGNQTEIQILQRSAELENKGFKAQIHPRNLNLFYLNRNERLRMERTESGFRTVDGSHSWTFSDALRHFESHPEELSPNVCLRPLYSQILLPDVGFVGGPAEIAYWLQLGRLFGEEEIPFPILVPRFSGLFISESQSRKWEKLGLTRDDLTLEESVLRKKLVKPAEDLELPDLELTYDPFIRWAQQTDPTLVPAVKAELAKMAKLAEGFSKRIQKAAEAREEQKLKQLSQLWEKFFPEGGLQERSEGWLSNWVSDSEWLTKVYETIDPFDLRFMVMEDRTQS